MTAARLPQPQATLTLRDLNRAALARQMLLRREALSTVEAVERLAGLQAQYSPSPYIALWSRVEGSEREHFTAALLDRRLVKASLMRWTLHVVSARDYPFFTVAMRDMRVASWRYVFEEAGLDVSAEGAGVDLAALHEKLLDFAVEPRLLDEMVAFVIANVPHDPDRQPRVARHAATGLGWLVHPPPSGTWKYFGKTSYVSARTWLQDRENPTPAEAVAYMVRRYLAAFGPATRPDVLQWSGLRTVTQVDAALQSFGDDLVAFRDEGGRILYDLSGALRPGGDTPAPVRFLPKWDNLLLAYEDRRRVLPEKYRKVVIRKNGDVLPTLLVDGVVAGVWEVTSKRNSAVLSMELYEPVDPLIRSLLEEEGDLLLRWMEPAVATYEVRFAA